jgi:mycothiol synthase
VRNAAFATLKGSETPITTEMAEQSATDALEGGALLLCRGTEPVGIVKVGEDDFDGETVAEIGPLALLPDWQGRGLGRQLLRAALCFAQESGYGQAGLCVNAENERAASLYLQEGFKKAETVICFRYDLNQE